MEIMAGMQYVHSKGIVICDIKPASILVNEYGSVKIGDFGSACNVKEPNILERLTTRPAGDF